MASGAADRLLAVVVDPNVLVSAVITDGVSRQVLDLAALGVYRLVACPRLLAELQNVLMRDKFLRWRTREQLDRFVVDIELLADLNPDPVDIQAATSDPDDDYLVALAVGARADLMCSGDSDLTTSRSPRS